MSLKDRDNNDNSEDEFIELTEENIEQLGEALEFDFSFYAYIADSDMFEIVSIPEEKGQIPSLSERVLLQKEAKKMGIKILYKISQGKQAIVYDSVTFKIGILPENDQNGFYC